MKGSRKSTSIEEHGVIYNILMLYIAVKLHRGATWGDVLQTMCIFLDAFESASGPDPCEEHNGTYRKGPDACFDNSNDVSLTQARRVIRLPNLK